MFVHSFQGKTECNSLSELQKVLNNRSKNNSNEFELRTNLEYPLLTILVRENYACVHYFENEDDCGHYAYIDDDGIKDGYITFNIGSENSETEISKTLIIPVEQAYIAAVDFYNTNNMSKRLKWFGL